MPEFFVVGDLLASEAIAALAALAVVASSSAFVAVASLDQLVGGVVGAVIGWLFGGNQRLDESGYWLSRLGDLCRLLLGGADNRLGQSWSPGDRPGEPSEPIEEPCCCCHFESPFFVV